MPIYILVNILKTKDIVIDFYLQILIPTLYVTDKISFNLNLFSYYKEGEKIKTLYLKSIHSEIPQSQQNNK